MKYKIPTSHSGIYFGYIKIKFLQALVWWVIYLTLQGKNIDLNHFKSDVLSDAIEYSRINFEDTVDGKGDLSNPK